MFDTPFALIAGRPIVHWVEAFFACHTLVPGLGGAAWVQWAWPDGRSYLEQPETRVQIFTIILSEATAALVRIAGRNHGRQDHD